MAWPCISRVCCLARRWNQLDRSDVAVPLTVHSYSDIEDPPPPPGPPRPGPPAPRARRSPSTSGTSAPRAGTRSPGPGRAGPGPGGGRRERDREPAAAPSVYVLPGGNALEASDGDPRFLRIRAPADAAPLPVTTSYRQEYRPWPATKPPRPIKTKATSIIVTDYTVRESSYRADFKVPEGRRKFSPNPSAVFQASPAPILHV
ncbi:LOW QUALITY PROTEIN: MAP6 domain-containing protein 1 [Antechinus flavipes]|uniref:LOW QUALITY PROTEIN: MAP6 domain-containing protein 1 n=1 Tax=Antechinus flavipes TaxID=38775 RepID=UPI0022362DB0|nr:LOW QUALITY PROTEIN: MAP6 domain-containing protein 1 [Antechinus flavipes]